MQQYRSQTTRRTTWRGSAVRAACLLAAALSLAGCVVYPAWGPGYGPHWHPWHGYYR